MTRYLIGTTTLFDDESFELSTLDDPVTTVSLGAAASRCLAALLEAQGSIVTKKALLYQGWERYGQQVSGNSVSQAVTQIRRCLVSLDQSPDWLVTVPRIGYKMASCVPVAQHETNTAQMPEGAPPMAALGQVLPVETQAPVLCLNVEKNCPAGRDTNRPGLWRRARTPLYLCAFLSLNTAVAFSWNALQEVSPLAAEVPVAYTAVGTQGPQTFFVGPSLAGKPDAISQHMAQLQRRPPSAQGQGELPYVYINGTLRDDVYSYFLCNEPLDSAHARCLSYLIVEEATS